MVNCDWYLVSLNAVGIKVLGRFGRASAIVVMACNFPVADCLKLAARIHLVSEFSFEHWSCTCFRPKISKTVSLINWITWNLVHNGEMLQIKYTSWLSAIKIMAIILPHDWRCFLSYLVVILAGLIAFCVIYRRVIAISGLFDGIVKVRFIVWSRTFFRRS